MDRDFLFSMTGYPRIRVDEGKLQATAAPGNLLSENGYLALEQAF
jgi:hypothetical protein